MVEATGSEASARKSASQPICSTAGGIEPGEMPQTQDRSFESEQPSPTLEARKQSEPNEPSAALGPRRRTERRADVANQRDPPPNIHNPDKTGRA
jgi:hypothetical protein